MLQTAGRLTLFGAAGTGTGAIAILLHVTLAASAACALLLSLALIAGKGRIGAASIIVASLLLGCFHAILSAFDVYQAIFINLTGNPAPTLIIFNQPLLALSLLDNVGVSPIGVAGALVALALLHVLLYLPAARLLLRAASSWSHKTLRLGRVHLPGHLAFAAGAVGLYAAVGAYPWPIVPESRS